MATMQQREADPRRFDSRMRRASILIREGHFDFEIDRNVLENALSVLHSLKEADEDEEDDEEEDADAAAEGEHSA